MHNLMNCPSCGGRATVSNQRCAACGAVVRTAAPGDALTSLGDAASPTAAGVPLPTVKGTEWPPDAMTGRGAYSEAPTDLGVRSEAPTDAGFPSAKAVRHPDSHTDPDVTRLGTPTGPRAPLGDSPTGPLSPGQPFGPRYHIVSLLGIGGMGAVYKAWDTELGVLVAVKVIRPEVAADPVAAAMLERRFKQELLLARQVTHKNVVRIHELGEIEGIKFITMPFIEGEELAAIIRRQDKLPIERVLKIARGIATGLEAAHAAGVVHRDLKPANIMVDKVDEAMIMDFGIARSTGGANPSPSTVEGTFRPKAAWSASQTMAGEVVGTIQYMAPEQARAEPVDQRADIYAFGLILYDMLLNQQRARGADTAIEELTSRMQAAPPAPRSIDPTIPEPVDRLVTRCIQPDAAERFQTTPDLVAALNRLDDRGHLLPALRRVTRRLVASVAGVFLALLGLTWWAARGPAVAIEHLPVSVLISDFQNGTGDPAFDRTLEPVMQLALEGAGFISAYNREFIRRTLGVRPPEKLDEQTALELAVKHGLNVVLAGTIAQSGSRYDVSVKAIHAVTGNVIATESDRASRKEDILGVVTGLAASVRRALGETTSDAAQRFAMEKLSATSLDAVREYAKGMEALSQSKFEDALQAFTRAVTLDPNFGTAYGAMAISSRNLDRQQDALKYANEAMRHLDGMTERERYRARGLYYYLTLDYPACVKEYGDLIAKYSADPAARNNRALCLSYLRDLSTAVEEMRTVVKLVPNRPLYRANLALYTAYKGDFPSVEQVVQEMPGPSLFAFLARAFAELGQGQRSKASQTYQAIGKIDEVGASYMASGLGDLATHEGRFSEAARILSQGAATDLAAKSPDKAAAKFAALAYVQVLRQRNGEAIAAADKALANSQAVKIRFLAARVYIEAGVPAKAEKISSELGGELQAEPQAYAAILDGLRAMIAGNNRLAIKSLTEANTLFDTWIGHFDLGRAYLAEKAYPQADSEFDRCLTRRGESLSLFLDEEPTFAFFPAAYYYQGLVREALRSTNFADSYRAYLEIRGNSKEDPLVPEVRKRAGG